MYTPRQYNDANLKNMTYAQFTPRYNYMPNPNAAVPPLEAIQE